MEDKMKIRWYGYNYKWHNSQMMLKYLEKDHDVTFVDLCKLCEYKRVVTETIEPDVDLVVCAQADARIIFVKINPNTTKIISYLAESYWSPGSMHSDYVFTCFPEMINRYKKTHPELFNNCIKSEEISIWIDPDLYDFDRKKKNKGIYYRGIRQTILGKEDDMNGGGHFRLYREAYRERDAYLEKYKEYITTIPPDYTDNYFDWISETEANLVCHAYLSYFAKRPLENAAAGCINCFVIRDEYEEKYLKEYGFINMVNCIYVKSEKDLWKFGMLDESVKQCIKKNAYDLIIERYTPEKVWNKIMEIISK